MDDEWPGPTLEQIADPKGRFRTLSPYHELAHQRVKELLSAKFPH